MAIYRTSSPSYVTSVEKALISHGFLNDYELWNIGGGGEGVRKGYPLYYVYVLLA